jgi:hypothetical protein
VIDGMSWVRIESFDCRKSGAGGLSMSCCSFFESVCVVFVWDVSWQFIRHWFPVWVGLASLWNGSGLWWFGFVEVFSVNTGVY